MYDISLYGLIIFYGLIGMTHFLNPKFYDNIVPKFLPNPRMITYISGVAEILIAVGFLFQETRSLTAIVLMIFLVAVFPANIVQIYQWAEKFKISVAFLWILRLPVQIAAIYWAYIFV
ncbi:MAG: DoxX family protein [Rhodothermaceae bacterium]